MNEKKMDEVVMDFRAQWSEDFRRAMEREPGRYYLRIGENATEIPNMGEYEVRFVVVITDSYSDNTGTAICNPSDKVDVLLGQAIAWARLNNIPLPKQLKPNCITTFKKLKVGQTYSYPDAIDGKFTVINKNIHKDSLIYTIYLLKEKRYDTIACHVYNSIDMNKKFNIC